MSKCNLQAMLAARELRTLFIDMDGTLTDLAFDRVFFTETLPRELARASGATPEQAKERVFTELAAIRGTLAWYSLANLSGLFGLDLATLTAELAGAVALQPGAIRFLAKAGKRYRRVLVTNADPAVLTVKLRHTGLAAWLDGVICAHHLGAAKEEAAFYERLAALEPDCPQAAILIDDNLDALAAARRAGLAAVTIARPDRGRPARRVGGRFVVDDIAALIDWLPDRPVRERL